MDFKYIGVDKLGNKHLVIPLMPLYELKLNGSILETSLLLDGKNNNSVHFIIAKSEITEIHIIDMEVDALNKNRGYGSLLLKALFQVGICLKIDKFFVSGELDSRDNIINNVNFYKNFLNIFPEIGEEYTIYFYKNKKEKIKVQDIYTACWFEYHKKNEE